MVRHYDRTLISLIRIYDADKKISEDLRRICVICVQYSRRSAPLVVVYDGDETFRAMDTGG